MSMTLDGMGCDQQGESNLLPALMAAGELLSREASHFVIMVMAAMAHLVNS